MVEKETTNREKPLIIIDSKDNDTIMELSRRAQRMSILQDSVVQYNMSGQSYQITPEMAKELFTHEDIVLEVNNINNEIEITKAVTEQHINKLLGVIEEEKAVAKLLFPDKKI